jgi:hemerythrin-like domain-containing protein
MRQPEPISRRAFLGATTAAAGGLLLAGCQSGHIEMSGHLGMPSPAAPEAGEDISPAEDLMREHGVLRRVLLVYEEAIERIEAGRDLPPETLPQAAGMVRTFVEAYHEKLEEDHLFPRFRKAGRLVDLVDVLLAQHQAGRRLTDDVLRLSAAGMPQALEGRRALIRALQLFIRMYAPHAAREDTVLFPAFHEIVTPKEYDELGDAFEAKENELFGDHGFEKMVDRVAEIEKGLGLYDLGKFTPGA